MLTLTRRGVSLLVTTAALGAAWAVLGLRDLGYLVAFLGACLVLAVLATTATILAPNDASAGPALSLETPTPAVGAAHTVRATLAFRLAPATAVAALWETPGGREETPVGPAGLAAARTVATSLAVSHRARGPALLRLVSVRVEDPLGLVRRRIAVGAEASVLVVPRLLTDAGGLGASAIAHDGGDPTDSVAAHTGQLGAPGSDIRDYRAGDSVRQIHWKQSARQRELVVRTPERDATRVAEVRLVTRPEAYASPEQFEHAVSVAATAGVRLLRGGNVVRVHAGSSEPEVFTSPGDLMRALAVVRLDGEEVVPSA